MPRVVGRRLRRRLRLVRRVGRPVAGAVRVLAAGRARGARCRGHRCDELLEPDPAQGQQVHGMLVHRLHQHVHQRGDVTAGTGPVQAVAVVGELGGVPRQQREHRGGELGLDLLRIGAGGQPRGQLGMGAGDLQEHLPVPVAVGGQVQTGLVQAAVGVLDRGAGGARLDLEPLHAAGARIGAPAARAARSEEPLGGLAQGDRLPGGADRSPAGAQLDAHRVPSPRSSSVSSRESRSSRRSSSSWASQSSP